MANQFFDRVRETTTTSGTGDITLAGAQTGYRTFSSVLTNGQTFYYVIADQGDANWEIGLGTYHSSGNTFTRTTVLASSNAGAAVNFTSATKDVLMDWPAAMATAGGDLSGTYPSPSIAATWAGQSAIVTVGTVTTGTWHGTKIGLAYGGTNADLSGTGGVSQYLKQSGVGSTITVGTIPAADVPVFIASGASHAVGIVPDPGGAAGTTKFLREDATWVVPSGSAYTADETSLHLSGTTFSVLTTWAGQAAIVTVGTITTGTWHATKIGLAYGGSNADLSATGGTGQYLKQVSSGAAVTVGTIPAADVPSLAASIITTGLLAQARGGTGIDTSGAADGQLLIGKSSDHSLNLATLTGTANRLVVTNGGGTITLNVSTSYAGDSTIVTVGTLTAGATGAGFTIALTTSTVTGTLGVAHGGTGATTFSANSLLVGNGTAAVLGQPLGVGQTIVGAATGYPVAANFPAVQKLTVNGGFDFFQAGTPAGTAYTFAGPNLQDTYTFDQKRCNNFTGLSGWTLSRQSGGPNSANYGKFLQGTRADKLLVYEPIEANVSQGLSNGAVDVAFQVQFRMPAGTAVIVNLGILKWTGTADTLPSAGVMSAWSSTATTDPTFATNYTMLGKVSLLATTSWQQLSTAIAVPAGVKNLVPIVWLDAETNSAGELDLAEWMLSAALCAMPWVPGDPQQELARCQRFFEKSYLVDTALGAASNPGFFFSYTGVGTVANGATFGHGTCRVTKRAAPTITIYSYTSGTASAVSNALGTDVAANSGISSNVGVNMFEVTNSSGGIITPGNNGFIWHFASDARL